MGPMGRHWPSVRCAGSALLRPRACKSEHSLSTPSPARLRRMRSTPSSSVRRRTPNSLLRLVSSPTPTKLAFSATAHGEENHAPVGEQLNRDDEHVNPPAEEEVSRVTQKLRQLSSLRDVGQQLFGC
jgi:hypothetical protein